MKTEDTEWNDLLRVYGILPQVINTQSSDDLDEINNDHITNISYDSEWEDLEDDIIVQEYMKRRREEMKAFIRKAKYGEIQPIQRSEWTTEVTETSSKIPVIVFLYKDSILASQQLSTILIQLANIYSQIKIVKIQGDHAIENYPDKNLPTLLIYHKGDIIAQKTCISINIDIQELEEWFIKLGILENKEVNQCRRLRNQKVEYENTLNE
ncbi:hypothetical protein PCANB_002210 [Pneumocystis canis]|nr:hypothetical protein PCK1_002359 [Pneumocystis canis]KAG5438880.1 hypothetical protein PCANB_002210 [Pneumocystis canis]